MNTVKNVVESNLCISCGACYSACPKSCIAFVREKGLYIPKINDSLCVKCGLCKKVCPGKGVIYTNCENNLVNSLTGPIKDCVSVRTKNDELYNLSASGGMITTLIKVLLQNDSYESAFLVDTYNYSEQVMSREYTKNQDLKKTPKSRYIPVSQAEAFAAMKKYPNKKIILVGTSCFVHAVSNYIKTFNLNRDNYLVIGLFCEKTMNYNVFDYFQFFSDKKSKEKKKMKELYFRSKEVNGWPGDVQIKYIDGSETHYSNSERMDVKDYFMPERCMYCLDKLNLYSDIAVGDDYTHGYTGEGRSSVIIRTTVGKVAFMEAVKYFDIRQQSIDDISKAQKLNGKIINYHFGKISGKDIEQISDDLNQNYLMHKNNYLALKKKMELGAMGDFTTVYRAIRKNRLERRLKGIIKKFLIQV